MKMQKSKRVTGRGSRAVRTFAVLGAAFILVWCDPLVSHAEATGTVIPSSVNIRKEPSQDSEVIGSTTGGKEISIRGKVDASGTTWYQVYVQGDVLGYIRADMVEKKGDGDIPTVSASTGADEGQASSEEGAEQTAPEGGENPADSGGAQVQAQETMDKQYATTKPASTKVRPDPSTSNNPVESIPSGTQVVVSGKSEGSDSKTWYYVTFTGSNGSEKTGYIRSDLLELGDMLPVEEPPVEEPPAEEPPVEEPQPSNDYELGMETDSEGEQVWYIYDHVNNKQQPLVPLLEASYNQMLGNTEDTDAIVKQRIVIVVLGVLLAVLVITVIVMAFKLRDAYYEDYDEDEEDEDEEEEEESSGSRASRRERDRETEERPSGRRASEGEERPARRREDGEERPARRREDEEERRPRRREEAARGKSDRPERRRREGDYEREQGAQENARPAKARKAKNFLLDDDEFEFEFLNMDDKDLK